MGKRGRPASVITEEDFVCEPSPTMLKLAKLKNEGGHTWRSLANELGVEVTHPMLRKVALGICKSKYIDIHLGITDETFAVTFEFANERDAKDFERVIDEYPGGRRKLAQYAIEVWRKTRGEMDAD